MRRNLKTIRAAGVGLLAGATALSALLAMVALNGGGEARLGPLVLMRLAAGYDRRAEPILAPATPPPPAERAHAAQLSRAALAQFPYDTPARLRLAYVETLASGRLTGAAAAELARSYDLVAVDPDVGPWRVRFALTFANQLSPELRQAVKTEVLALGQGGPTRQELKSAVAAIADPTGAVWLMLWLGEARPSVAH